MTNRRPTLCVVAGPNGSGKTTTTIQLLNNEWAAESLGAMGSGTFAPCWKVMGMSRDCITFEGQDVNELRHDFEGAVDDYLASCAARGVEPAKPYSGTFNVRVSPEIHSAIAMLTQGAGMSINAFIRQVLAKEVDLAY